MIIFPDRLLEILILITSTIMFIYAIYDKKANYYATPFYLPTDTHAIREFTRIVHDSNSNLNKFPEDYSIVCFGEFDDSVGVFNLYAQLRTVIEGIVVRKDVVQLEKEVVSEYIQALRDTYTSDLNLIRKSLDAFHDSKIQEKRKSIWSMFK